MTAPKAHPLPTEAAPALQRNEGLAAWRQIADGIEGDITSGLIRPGDKLPTEADLAARFGVNRHTVRRALAVLASRGLVRTTQGRGTFVEANPIAYPIGPKTRFSEVMSRAGREAWGELMGAGEAEADERIAEALGLAAGDRVLALRTRHSADGTPISMAQIWLPLPRFAGLDRSYRRLGSLTKAFAKHGVADYTRLSTRVSARAAALHEAQALELVPGRVVLVIDSINVDAEGRRIQATRSLFAADRVELVIEP